MADDNDVDINQVDSKGRTAMEDLAPALRTGQVSFLQLFEDHNGRFENSRTLQR